MQTPTEKWAGQMVAAILQPNAKVIRATKFVSPKEIIRATRRTYKGKIIRGNVDIVLTIGRPNYAERKLVRIFQKAGEPFPVKYAQLKLAK